MKSENEEHGEVIELPYFGDKNGVLTVLESNLLPFKIARTYWISASDGAKRGGHRHIKTHQALVAVSGEVLVYLNDGKRAKEVSLTRPNQCLLLYPDDWHTMVFKKNTLIVVFASHPYDPSDYIDQPYPLQ